LKIAILKMDQDNQLMFESMSRRVNESMISSRSEIIDECGRKIAKAVGESGESVRSEVNSCLKSGTQQLTDTVCNLEKKIDTFSKRLNSFEESLASFRDSSFRAESDATHALSLCGDNKRVLVWCDDMLKRLDKDMENLSRDIRRQDGGGVGAYHSQSRHSMDTSGVRGGLDKTVADLRAELTQQGEKITTITKILEDHRADYTEAVSRLSTAGRKAKAGQQELFDRLQAIGDIKAAVDRVLNDVVSSSDEDKRVMISLKEDATAVSAELDALRSSMIELAELMPKISDVKQSIQDSLNFYHDTEVTVLADQIVNLEVQLVNAGVLLPQSAGNEDLKGQEEEYENDDLMVNQVHETFEQTHFSNGSGRGHPDMRASSNVTTHSQSPPTPPPRHKQFNSSTPSRVNGSSGACGSAPERARQGGISHQSQSDGFYPSLMMEEDEMAPRLAMASSTATYASTRTTHAQSQNEIHSQFGRAESGYRGSIPNKRDGYFNYYYSHPVY
jgi:hypothetical protein